MPYLRRGLLAFLLLAILNPGYLAAQGAGRVTTDRATTDRATTDDKDREKALAEIKANYTKYEYRIPMRDGKRLFTAVYVPKDDSQKYPILLTRTPYNVKPYGADQYKDSLGPSPLFTKAGYIF